MTEMELFESEEAAEARFDRTTDIMMAALIPLIIVGTIGVAVHQVGISLGWWS